MKKVLTDGMLFLALLLGISASTARAESVRVVVPYLGSIKNVYENDDYGIKLEDSSLMKGLYFQWVDTERYQWNAFVYQASDINYSTLWGGHFVFDYYLGPRGKRDWVIGAGFEIVSLDMDAGDEIAPLLDFKLSNSVYFPFARAGKYFRFKFPSLALSLFPWAGIAPQWVRGEVSFHSSGPFPPPVNEEIREYDFNGIAGLNMKGVLLHFLEAELKYQAIFGGGDYFSSLAGMVNLFFTRHIGLSYRFRYMETSNGEDTYHIGGVAFVF